MRLIDADALKKTFVKTMTGIAKKTFVASEESHVYAACHMLCEMIDDAETIETEPIRHGHWKPMVFADTGMPAGFKCSECGNVARVWHRYCQCGAKMDMEVVKDAKEVMGC